MFVFGMMFVLGLGALVPARYRLLAGSFLGGAMVLLNVAAIQLVAAFLHGYRIKASRA